MKKSAIPVSFEPKLFLVEQPDKREPATGTSPMGLDWRHRIIVGGYMQ